MNAGLTSLSLLKSWLLPASMVAGVDYDDQIQGIGRGVAGLIDTYCNRKIARVVGDTFEISGNRMHLVVPRYPLEAVTKIELRESMSAGWIDQGVVNSLVSQLVLEAGLIDFGSIFGASSSRIRVTYTGGYWFNEQDTDYAPPAEPTTEDPDLSLLPSGATLLPADLQLAFQTQCEWVWTKRDKLGLSIGEKQDNVFGGSLAKVVLLDGVKEQLNSYKRYSLT